MQFFCRATIIFFNKKLRYKVSRINDSKYLVQPEDISGSSFILTRHSTGWVAQGEFSFRFAKEIGKQIDRLQFYTKLCVN